MGRRGKSDHLRAVFPLDQHYTTLPCAVSAVQGEVIHVVLHLLHIYFYFSHFSLWLLNSDDHYKIVSVTHWSLQFEAEQHRDTLTAGGDMSAGED